MIFARLRSLNLHRIDWMMAWSHSMSLEYSRLDPHIITVYVVAVVGDSMVSGC